MARLRPSDDCGAVYVEFLIAFFPLFLLFLAVCQLALVASAEALVQHSAFTAIRSAIVVLEDSPVRFDGAPRGNLSQGRPSTVRGADEVLRKLGIVVANEEEATTKLPQEGARMVPIQTAAVLPLLPLAPRAGAASESVSGSIVAATEKQLPYALKYTKVATRVSVHDAPGNVSLANEPVGAKANVTVRVGYLFHCAIPVVRVLMCRGLEAVAKANPGQSVERLRELIGREARFKYLTAEATLPNQGAGYYAQDGK